MKLVYKLQAEEPISSIFLSPTLPVSKPARWWRWARGHGAADGAGLQGGTVARGTWRLARGTTLELHRCCFPEVI